MSSPQIIFQSQQRINCSRVLQQYLKGERHFKHYNSYLIPYSCSNIDYDNRMIMGNFIYPMWNTLERTILTKGDKFEYSYIKGKDFTIELNPSSFKKYHIFGRTFVYPNAVEISETVLKPNTILLFSIPKIVADPLIQNKLM